MAENQAPSSFWSGIVKPEQSIELEYPEDAILTLTSACLGELPDDFEKTPIRLFADIETIVLEGEDGHVEKNKLLIATFIPGELEFNEIQHTFTPFNNAKLYITGKYPVHIIGKLGMFDDGLEEEEWRI